MEGGKSTLDLPLGSSQLIEMCFDDMMRERGERADIGEPDSAIH
jgi:hypothetical protein